MLGKNIGNGIGFFFQPFYEIAFSIGIGAVLGLILSIFLAKEQVNKDRILVLSIATVLMVLGLTLMMNVDVLLASMALGSVLVNRVPRISKDVFKLVIGFTPPIYVLFFVLVGAKLNLSHLSFPLALLVIIYLVGRSGGKMIGANLGAKFSHATKLVQKYLPFCLFSQAGVAIALTMVVSSLFPGDLGNFVVIIIAISTFVVQIIGPPATKFAVTKAGEVGLDVTEEDLISQAKVHDLPGILPPVIYKNMPLMDVLNIFKRSDYLYYPVIDENKKIIGVITVESIKQTFMETDLGQLLLAHDLMEPVRESIYQDEPLIAAKDKLNKFNLKYLPVMTKQNTYAGIIEQNAINKFSSTKMLELEQKIEALA